MQPETGEPKERFAEPGNVLSQWWTMGKLLQDSRRSASHDAVYWVIINSRDSKTGLCRASMSFIATALRGSIASRETIKKAVHDLAEWGYIKPLPRRRRNDATKFEIPWAISSRGLAEQTASGLAEQTASGLVHQTESYIPSDGSTGGKVCNEVSAAPDADGLSATAPASGFEEAWKAYDRHGNKSKARAAWAAIEWSRYDYGPEHVIERAASWAASAKPGQRRMPLERWLEQERFDEADRAVAPKPKSDTAQNARYEPPTPANDNRPAATRQTVQITKAWINRNSQCTLLSASLERLDGQPVEPRVIHIAIEDYERAVQERGQIEFEQLLTALDLPTCEEPEELIGRPFELVISGDGDQEFHAVNPQRETA